MAEFRNLTPFAPLPSAPTTETAPDAHPLWQSVLEVLRGWLQEQPRHDQQHERLALAMASIEDFMRKNDYSIEAKTVGRALMCVNCRRLNANQVKCSGRPLEKCPLLTGNFHAH